MGLRLNGSTSGYTEIDAPAVAGSNTLVLPTGNGTNGQYLQTNGSGTLSWSGSLTLDTAKNSTSGTNIDFTGIPSWVKRVTVMLSAVSTNGTSGLLFRLGTSSGLEASSYNDGSIVRDGASVGGGSNGTGFAVTNYAVTDSIAGQLILSFLASNTWVATGSFVIRPASFVAIAGSKTLSGTLDRIRITTVSGDTFDNGSINIMYEG